MFISRNVEKIARTVHEHIIENGHISAREKWFMTISGTAVNAASYEHFDYNGDGTTYDHLHTGTWWINLSKHPVQASGNRKQMFLDLTLFLLTHDTGT